MGHNFVKFAMIIVIVIIFKHLIFFNEEKNGIGAKRFCCEKKLGG